MRTTYVALTTLMLCLSLACDRKAPPPAERHEGHDHGPREKQGEKDPHEGHDHGPGEKKGAKDDHEGHDHGEVLALEGVRGVRWAPVAAPRAEGIWQPGEAIADERTQALVASPVKGVVAELLAIPGQRLGKGAPVAVIQSPELARLKADWLTTRAKVQRLETDLAREQRLFDAKAGSRRDLEAAQAEAAVAKAEEEAARLALEARGVSPDSAGSRLVGKAPGPGTVVGGKVVLGQGVEAGQELSPFQGALAGTVKVELPQEGGLAWVPGARTRVRLGQAQWGAVVEGAPLALTETHRVVYRLRLQGANLPVPGALVEVQVAMPTALFLPQAALQQVDGVWGVFLKEKDGAVFRPVSRGPLVGQEVVLLSGLKPGETVAVEGAYLLKSLQMKRAGGGEAGHNH